MPNSNTPVHLRLRPSQVRPFSMDGASLSDLAALGVELPPRAVKALREEWNAVYSMDGAGPQPVTLASSGTPIQFLQTMLSGSIRTVTAARKIDALVGRTIAGKWSDEEIIMPVVELVGKPRIYGDKSPGPFSSFNVSLERRTVVRFEMDMEVEVLEEERAAAIRQNSGELKRAGITEAMAIEHNRIGFFGYNNGASRVYGFLNDPALPNYSSVPPGASGSTKFINKTYEEITADFVFAASRLRTKTGEAVDPEKAPCTLSLSSCCRDALNIANVQGKTVKEWLRENYPNWTIESATELDGANGGLNVFYLFAQEVAGGGEDGRQKVVEQYVPAVLRLLGVERRAKGSFEAYSSATAGLMWQGPFAVVRCTGI